MAHETPPSVYEEIQNVINSDEPAISRLWEWCNPFMASLEYGRTAATIMLASGPDRNGIRGRCHVLLVGAEGTGKSEILDWIAEHKDNAYASGPSDSEAGLKGNFAHNPPQPGALQLAHEGVLCVEELDKFNRGDRDALYEAMGKGHYTVNKGDVRNQQYDASVRVIAAANDKSQFRDAFLDRFDFVVDVTQYDAAETEDVTLTLLENFSRGYVDDEPIDSANKLIHYLKYLSALSTPSLPDDEKKRIAEQYRKLIHDEGRTGNIRQKESYMRVAYVLAKLDNEDITVERFNQAIALIHGDSSPLTSLLLSADTDAESDTPES